MSETIKQERRRIVQSTAAKLRNMVMAEPPEAKIGSLNEIAQALGVGIVTVQQAARVLEHEGLLAVRRGPGGGYYGKRPDEAVLERAIAEFMRVHQSAYMEVAEMTTLLDCELGPIAARCTNEDLRGELRRLSVQVDSLDSPDDRVRFENDLHEVLYAMADRPLMALLARVARGMDGNVGCLAPLFPGEEGVIAWKSARKELLRAILNRDEELAHFEANRYRRVLLERVAANWREPPPKAR